MNYLSYDSVVAKLLEAFPEIQESYHDQEIFCTSEGTPMPHVVFALVFNPFISSVREDSVVERVFRFTEMLAGSSDTEVKNLIAVTLLAHIRTDTRLMQEAQKYMGPTTQQLFQEYIDHMKKLARVNLGS